MDNQLKKELSEILAAYLSGWKTIGDLYEWLAGVNWDEGNLDADAKQILGTIELLATEVFEGMREEDELLQEASDFVARITRSRYVVPKSQVVVASSSSDSLVQPISTATISPLTVQT